MVRIYLLSKGGVEFVECLIFSLESLVSGSFEAGILDNVGEDIGCTTTHCGSSASAGYYGGLP